MTDLTRFDPRHLARRLALSAAIAAAALAAPPLPAQTPPQAASFDAVRQRLELGGPLFVFMDYEDEVTRLGRDLTKTVADLVGDDPELAIYKQDFGQILDELGIAGIRAVGMSSTVRREGGYHNRGFIHVPGQRRGLLAAFGGPAKPFATTSLAPADTDLFLESELDLPALIQALTTVANRFVPGADLDMVGGALAGETGVDASDAIKLLASIRGRITLALRLGETTLPDASRIEEWGLGFAQKANLLLRVEGIGQGLLPLLQKVGELQSSTVNGRTVFRASEIIPVLGDNQPAIVIDGDAVLLGSSLAFIEQSLARTDGLAQAPQFRRTLAAVGLAEGNSLAYGTPRMLQLTRQLIGAALEMSPTGGNEALVPVLRAILGRIPDLTEPLASVVANVPDGILMHANSIASLRAAMLSLAIYNPDILGPVVLAVLPAAIKAQLDQRREAHSAEIAEANLKLIGEAALAWFKANPGADEVTYNDLQDVLAGKLGAVKDLDFTDFTLERGFTKIELDLPNGQSITWLPPFTDEDRETVRRNLQLFDRATAWYFRKYPQETVMLGMEAIEDGSPMKELPDSVRGESYRQLQIRKTDTEIAIEVGDEVVTIKRDPALQQQPRQQQQQQRRPAPQQQQQRPQPQRGG